MVARAKQTRQRTSSAGAGATVAGTGKTAKPKARAAKATAKTARPLNRSKRSAVTGPPDDRAALEGELAAAKVRIAELEKQHEDAVNRIDWVIDSLQMLLAEQK